MPGHAYDPDSNTWRTISDGPKPATYGATGVWTGEEVVICCGAGSQSTAAYDPADDSWRPLEDAPISGEYAEAVWTGDEMVVVTEGGVVALDPVVDEWRSFPDAPVHVRLNEVVWTGTDLIVWPAEVARRTYRGMAFDPSTETWRVLPAPPAWPAVVDIAWTGSDLIVWGGLEAYDAGSERAVGSRLDVEANVWTELPEPLPEPDGCECNLGSQTLVWTGHRLLVSTGHFASGVYSSNPLLLAYDPAEDVWSLIGQSPARWGWGARALMAGDRVVLRADRLYVSELGWAPTGSPVPPGGVVAAS